MMIRILLITNKTDITTDYIVRGLKEKEIPFYRLNTEEIGNTISVNFDVKCKSYKIEDEFLNTTIDLLEIRAVYFRRPELRNPIEGLSQAENSFIAGEISYTLEGLYKILASAEWVNSIGAIRNAENKIYQLQIAQEIGFSIPDSIITTQDHAAEKFFKRNEQDCIIKPIKSGLVAFGDIEEGIIFTSRVRLDKENLKRVRACPTFLQKHIRKKGDVRVTVIGRKLFAVLIHSQDSEESKTDWRKSQINLKHTEIQLPDAIEEKCFQLTERLSLNFGAVDFILDEEGNYVFLEINPNGQWAWIERLLGLKMSEAIVNLLIRNLNERENQTNP